MKLIYIANARIPTEKAHGIQIIKTCESLAGQGVDLELWLPKRINPQFSEQDIYKFYKVQKNFQIRRFSCLDLIDRLNFISGLGFYIQSKTFARGIGKELERRDYSAAIFYSRDTYPLVPVEKKGLPFFYEIHTIGKTPSALTKFILGRALGVVAITQGIAGELKKYISEKKILVAYDGVDLKDFIKNIPKKEARLEFGLPADKKIVLYSGHLYEWKGASVLAQAAEFLGNNILVYLVGGTERDLAEFKRFLEKNKLSKVKLVGRVPHQQIPGYLSAADVLVIPNSARFDISKYHTSPLKMFEYMAAQRPIIASDLPSLREVLDESTAIFFTPDDPISLSKKIEALLAGELPSELLVSRAYEKVQKFSWRARTKEIINFLKNKIGKND